MLVAGKGEGVPVQRKLCFLMSVALRELSHSRHFVSLCVSACSHEFPPLLGLWSQHVTCSARSALALQGAGSQPSSSNPLLPSLSPSPSYSVACFPAFGCRQTENLLSSSTGKKVNSLLGL